MINSTGSFGGQKEKKVAITVEELWVIREEWENIYIDELLPIGFVRSIDQSQFRIRNIYNCKFVD